MKNNRYSLPTPSPRDEVTTRATTPGYQHLDVSSVASARTVEFHPSHKLTSGSRRKTVRAIRLVKSAFRQHFKCVVQPSSHGIAIECPETAETAILELCAVVDQRLMRLEQEPLTAKMVEEVLSITAAELRRWSKDGRMPTAGRAFFGQGHKQVGLFMYSQEVIRELTARPERIAAWRRSDRDAMSLHKESSLAR